MKFLRFLFRDWMFGIFLTVLVIVAFSLEFYPLYALDYLAYDFMSGLRRGESSGKVVIVAVDDKSEKTAGWPLPRSYMAEVVEQLSNYGPKVIGVDALYAGEEQNPGLDELMKMAKSLNSQGKTYRSLMKVKWRVDGDTRLWYAAKTSGKVVFPLLFSPGEDNATKGGKMPGFLRRNSASLEEPARGFKGIKADLLALKNPLHSVLNRGMNAVDVTHPYWNLAEKTRALGHINHEPDRDGVIRSEPLLISYNKRAFPAFGLQVALRYFGKNESSLKGVASSGGVEYLSFPGMKVPAAHRRMLINYGGVDSLPRYSFADVMEGKVPLKKFRDKAVFVGYTGSGAKTYTSPVGPLTEVELSAMVAENVINNSHIVRPSWAFGLEVALILYFGLLVTFVLPRVTPKVGIVFITLSILPAGIIATFLFFSFGYWLMFFSPSVLLVAGFLVAVGREYVAFGRRSEMMAESFESNKMLGLSFQGQGMLDMAFDKFMKLPVRDKSVKELLYNLALDFERKRMLAKAKAVYEHILRAGNFKDAKERIKKLRKAGDTLILGPGASRKDATVLMNGAGTKPTLGRYEVLKELGRGAMGTVYLGRDPKINREVAIKTLVYEEVEEDQLKEVKRRFFKEAEAAGRLSHPNIMTIFDAGEDHDMAYMAMELLPGNDLSQHCTKGSLLQSRDVMRIMADVAGALDYAHNNGVVHRDIKPANIMLLGDGTVKVTDFGIARVIESSKTTTGMILGTPSYMSPEQVSGEKVEGTSDLFSLGAVFYELLSGEKAFKGDSIASIMYNISVCDYVPLKNVAKKVPDCCDSIVKRLLAKSVTRRYKTGAEVAKDIKTCMEKGG